MIDSERKFPKSLLLQLFVIGLVALLMRVVIGEVIRPIHHHDGMTGAYFVAATNILEHGVLSGEAGEHPVPSALRMPLYSIYLAGIRILSGPAQWENWVIALQYFFGSLVCVLIALLGVQLMGERAGIIAGFLAVFSVELYYLSIVLLRDNLGLFALLLFLNASTRFLRTKNSKWAVASAFIFGMGLLIRPELILVGGVLLFLFKDVVGAVLFKNIRITVLIAVGAFFPWIVWMVRNVVVFHHFIPLSTEGAWALYMGQVYPPHEAYTVADPTAIRMISSTPNEYDWYRQMNHEAWQAFIHNPIRNLSWVWLKIRDTFNDYSKNGLSLLFPLMWALIPWFGLKNSSFRKKGVIIGLMFAFLHLNFGHWNFAAPIGLLHVGFSDVIFLGFVGISLFILREPNEPWKVLAAPFLTLIFCNAVYVAHYRQRIYLFDWVVLLGAAYLISETVGYLQLRFNKI